MALQSWMIDCLKMYKISELIKFTDKTMEIWTVELTAGGKCLAEVKILRAITTTIFIAMIPLNHIFRKYTGGYKLTKSPEKSCILLYMCNILTFDLAINQGTGASGRRHQDITLTVDGLNSVQMRRHKKQVNDKQLYNPVPRRVELVGVSLLEFELQFEAVRTRTQQRAGLPGPPVEQPSRTRKKCCYNTEELGIYMWQSVQSPTYLSHIILSQPFRKTFE